MSYPAASANPNPLPSDSSRSYGSSELASDRDALVFLSSLPLVTPPRLADIISWFGSYRELAAASPAVRAARLGPWASDLKSLPAAAPETVLPRGVSVLTPSDCAYPELLRRHPQLAPVLFVNGDLPETVRSATPEVVAVTGSRFPSRTGLAVSANACRSIARYSMVTVSVMAPGVGASAITTAVGSLGTAIAVLPSGHGCYPAPQVLADLVAFSGCSISPFHPSTPPTDSGFHHATRLAVAMSSAVVTADVGSPLSSHRSHAPDAAWSVGVPIIAPHPEDPAFPAHADLGLLSLTSRRHRDPGSPAAAAAVSDPISLDDAIREVSIRLRHRRPSHAAPVPRVGAAPDEGSWITA